MCVVHFEVSAQPGSARRYTHTNTCTHTNTFTHKHTYTHECEAHTPPTFCFARVAVCVVQCVRTVCVLVCSGSGHSSVCVCMCMCVCVLYPVPLERGSSHTLYTHKQTHRRTHLHAYSYPCALSRSCSVRLCTRVDSVCVCVSVCVYLYV